MEKIRNIICAAFIVLLTIGFLFTCPSNSFAKKLTHTVQKGDTLWSICEKYYGDPNVWPKLWQLNSFITNPHLIIPGEVITLFEKEEPPVVETVEEPPVEKEEVEPKVMGIDVEGLTKADSMGFLSYDKISPWGVVFASNEKKMILSKGDTAYVLFEKDKNIKTGDIFSIGTSSRLLKNPVNGDDLGYVFSVIGKLVIEEPAGIIPEGDEFVEKKNSFKAKIIASHEPVYVNESLLMPFKSIPSCVPPLSVDKEILANIVAAKAQQILLNPGSIVYINIGSNAGVKIGNLFEVAEGNIAVDPKPEKTTFYKSIIVLPDNSIGRILVLDTKPDTSTAIVISALKSFSAGAYIKDISWTEKPDFLMKITNCPIE
jgi:LysM repeat protein